MDGGESAGAECVGDKAAATAICGEDPSLLLRDEGAASNDRAGALFDEKSNVALLDRDAVADGGGAACTVHTDAAVVGQLEVAEEDVGAASKDGDTARCVAGDGTVGDGDGKRRRNLEKLFLS